MRTMGTGIALKSHRRKQKCPASIPWEEGNNSRWLAETTPILMIRMSQASLKIWCRMFDQLTVVRLLETIIFKWFVREKHQSQTLQMTELGFKTSTWDDWVTLETILIRCQNCQLLRKVKGCGKLI